MRHTRILASVAAAICLTFVSSGAWAAGETPRAAHAVVPGCHGANCTGRDPHALGCDNPRPDGPDEPWFGRLIELRHSNGCKSAWGRVTNGRPGDFILVQNTLGQTETATIRTGSDTHTLMVNDESVRARACLTPVGGPQHCTGYF